jgi:hypothetical protein
LYTLGRTCLQREHAVSVCATRDDPSSAALLSLPLPLAGPAAAGACIPPVLVYEGDGSLSQRSYRYPSAPHAVARTRPPVPVLSHKADSLSVL